MATTYEKIRSYWNSSPNQENPEPQEPQEHPFLKELKEQDVSAEELQAWREIVRKDRKAKQRNFQKNPPELTLMVLGLAGMGKSTLLNGLLQEDVFFTGSAEQSSGVTKDILSVEGKRDNVSLEVIDTPGFGDLTVSPRKWCIQFYFNAYQKKVSQILFVLRADSERVGRWNLILFKLLAEFIKDDPEGNPVKNIVLVFTHVDKLNQKEIDELPQKCERIKEQFNQKVGKLWKVEQIFYFAKDQIDDVKEIYKYALDNRKEKKLELQLPNLTLVKDMLKDELGYDEEQLSKKEKKKSSWSFKFCGIPVFS